VLSLQGQTISYSAERIIGNGSFGVVFQAPVALTLRKLCRKSRMVWQLTAHLQRRYLNSHI
jgi:hypothetical protein